MFQRHALYFAPPEGSDLARLGAAWLGRDAAGGVPGAAPVVATGGRALADLTASARRYGLHGTLKPPMRLAEGRGADELIETAAAWAARRAPVPLGRWVLAPLGPFLALVPDAQPAALTAFAADLVRDLDAFRAPPTEAELARRRASGLSARQEGHLAAWGYPYVLDEFRFHVTLTDALAAPESGPVQAAAAAWFAPVIGQAAVMADLAVFGEDAAGLFHLLTRLPLQG